MIWQDLVLSGSSIVFSVALVPQVYHGFKEKIGVVKLATSGPTFLGLYAVCTAYISLGLYFSSVTCFIVGTLWLLLFILRLKYRSQ